MWLCTKLGFYSIVQKAPDEVHVRARCKKDLENLKKAVKEKIHRGASLWKIVRTEPADYRFRMVVSAVSLQSIMQVLALELDYPNFKGVIANTPDQADKLGAYSAFHHDMEMWQRRKSPLKTKNEPFFEMKEGLKPGTQEYAEQLRRLIPGIENATD